ncbi:MAG: sn-glycerol-3-phosphate ABC transporter ATP-binding protein UgpC [Actinobacteria bacterium]|nr:sn-glycerol-3-phosphate ABC transporter ATP-binding protein UgpC [Actinomycetota bacterium]
MADVKLEGITKIYPDGTKAVADLDLHIQDGEFVVLVGPSGCGKTTALRMVAGLEEISGGKLSIGDRVVNDVAPKDRDIAMVFQNYALYPHLSVKDNIGFGLKLRKTPQDEIDRRVKDAAEILGLEELLHRRPKALSGGQRQRVAMGRAIVREPQAFLMDEPLSNLDAKLRVQMRAEISRLQRDLGTTTLYVTHDQVEAMTMGDRVAVMRKGLLQQVAPPQQLYDQPVNLFVGGFIGSPAMNMIEAALSFKGNKASVTFGDQELVVGDEVLGKRPALRDYDGASVVLGIRPEDMDDAALAGNVPEGRTLRSKAELREALGSDVLVHFGIDAPPVLTEDTKELAEDAGGTGTMVETDLSGKRTIFVARFHPDSAVTEDGEVRVAVDTERLHFFDLDSGDAVWD